MQSVTSGVPARSRKSRSPHNVKRFTNTPAKHGYTIVREYVDDGISGDSNDARKAFLRMRDELTSGDDADIVLVWAYDRISRNDSDEESASMFPFREAGISVESVTEGLIDPRFLRRTHHTHRQAGRAAQLHSRPGEEFAAWSCQCGSAGAHCRATGTLRFRQNDCRR